jgi:hypothetical protein
MAGMEHDRFDDVEVRFLHDPDSPQLPPRRRRRWVAGAAAAAIAVGGFAAVASAGGGSSGEAAAPAAEKERTTYPEAGYQHMRQGKPCDRDGKRESRRDRDASELRY